MTALRVGNRHFAILVRISTLRNIAKFQSGKNTFTVFSRRCLFASHDTADGILSREMEEAEMLAETHSAHGARLNGFDQHMLQRRSPPTGLDSIAVIARRNRGEEIHRSDAAD